MKFGVRLACSAYIERDIAENFISFIKTNLPKTLTLISIEKKEVGTDGQPIIGDTGDYVRIAFWVSITNYPDCENSITDSQLEEENNLAFRKALEKRGYKEPNTIGGLIIFAEEATITKRDILVREEKKKMKSLFYSAQTILKFGLRKREHWNDYLNILGPWIGEY